MGPRVFLDRRGGAGASLAEPRPLHANIAAWFAQAGEFEPIAIVWDEAQQAFVDQATPGIGGIASAIHFGGRARRGDWAMFAARGSAEAAPPAVRIDYCRYYGLKAAALLETPPPSDADAQIAADMLMAADLLIAADAALAEKWRAWARGRETPSGCAPRIEAWGPQGPEFDLVAALAASPLGHSRLALASGSAAEPARRQALTDAGALVHALCWDGQALIPAAEEATAVVDGLAVVVELETIVAPGDLLDIAAAARGLGMTPMLSAPAGRLLSDWEIMATGAYRLVLFDSLAARDAALARARRLCERAATLPARFRVAASAREILACAEEGRSPLSRNNVAPAPGRFGLCGGASAAARDFTAGLAAALIGQGVEVEMLDPSTPDHSWIIGVALEPQDVAAFGAAARGRGRAALIVAEAAAEQGPLVGIDLLCPLSWRAGERARRTYALAGFSPPQILPCPSAQDAGDYARRLLGVLSHAATGPTWPAPAITGRARPLLTCAITTYNRAPWLRHSLRLLMERAAPYGRDVEVVVCDNASTDDTPAVMADLSRLGPVLTHRNGENVGMLGNLGATARLANGRYVWLLGDDDLVTEAGLAALVAGLSGRGDVEMAYMNYAYTRFDRPELLAHPDAVIRKAKPIGYGGPNRRAARLRDVACFNENLFTAIYACAFRRDHALRAYQQDVSGSPFSSLLTCVPSSVYALTALADRPALWIGEAACVVNLNVSWLKWALLWSLERMPDLHDLAELAGVDPVRIDRQRLKYCGQAADQVREALFEAPQEVAAQVSAARLLERCKHLPAFRESQLAQIREVYSRAWAEGRVKADTLAPERLFAAYGLD